MCYTLPFKLYHTYCRTSIYAEKKGLNAFFSAYRGFLHATSLSHSAKRRASEGTAREALNKSRHAPCLHIFRLIARKLLEIHQVFLRLFHAIRQKICLRNLHTRFNQHFPDPRGRAYSCLRQLYASGGLPPDRPFRLRRNGRARAVRSLHFVPNAALQFYVIRQRN